MKTTTARTQKDRKMHIVFSYTSLGNKKFLKKLAKKRKTSVSKLINGLVDYQKKNPDLIIQ